MTARTSRHWTLWLLPLIAVQFGFTAGVMPGHTAAGATFVLCGVGAGAAGAPSHAHHHGSSSGDAHADKVCPFGAAASATPTSVVQSATLEFQPVSIARVSATARRNVPSGPTRTQLSRAPPSLS